MDLRHKVALVTGGAKRVGREIALALAARGADVAITYRTSHREALDTVSAIEQEGVRASALKVDQRNPSQVRRAVEKVGRHFGQIDLLVNNASSFYPTPLGRVTESQWRDLIEANLSGPWRFAQAAALLMKRRRKGKIINIADVAAFKPWPSSLPYCAAKGGLVTLTWGLARALAPDIQVNAVAPGPILFPPGMKPKEKRVAIRKTLLKRSGSPQDVVEAVLYLARSDFVTGVVLPVDGGRLLA